MVHWFDPSWRKRASDQIWKGPPEWMAQLSRFLAEILSNSWTRSYFRGSKLFVQAIRDLIAELVSFEIHLAQSPQRSTSLELWRPSSRESKLEASLKPESKEY